MTAGRSKHKIKVGAGLCGRPMTDGYGLKKARQNCPKCAKYKNVLRQCLRCSNLFRPGCKTPHTCSMCALGKRAKETEATEGAWIYFA